MRSTSASMSSAAASRKRDAAAAELAELERETARIDGMTGAEALGDLGEASGGLLRDLFGLQVGPEVVGVGEHGPQAFERACQEAISKKPQEAEDQMILPPGRRLQIDKGSNDIYLIAGDKDAAAARR